MKEKLCCFYRLVTVSLIDCYPLYFILTACPSVNCHLDEHGEVYVGLSSILLTLRFEYWICVDYEVTSRVKIDNNTISAIFNRTVKTNIFGCACFETVNIEFTLPVRTCCYCWVDWKSMTAKLIYSPTWGRRGIKYS